MSYMKHKLKNQLAKKYAFEDLQGINVEQLVFCYQIMSFFDRPIVVITDLSEKHEITV